MTREDNVPNPERKPAGELFTESRQQTGTRFTSLCQVDGLTITPPTSSLQSIAGKRPDLTRLSLTSRSLERSKKDNPADELFAECRWQTTSPDPHEPDQPIWRRPI
jgi:hypothetical protein